MTLHITHNLITGHTLRHLHEWIESIGILANTPDWPFPCLDDLAMQLEMWREEFQRINQALVSKESVKVLTYGEAVILLCDERTGEYIKLTTA